MTSEEILAHARKLNYGQVWDFLYEQKLIKHAHVSSSEEEKRLIARHFSLEVLEDALTSMNLIKEFRVVCEEELIVRKFEKEFLE